MRVKIAAAGDYLEVAPAVVKVVRDLQLPAFDALIRPSMRMNWIGCPPDWDLGSSLKRARDALARLA